MDNILTIEFPDKKTKDQFASWLSRQGEQSFQTELDLIDGKTLNFNFHGPTKPAKGKNFLIDNKVRVTIVEE